MRGLLLAAAAAIVPAAPGAARSAITTPAPRHWLGMRGGASSSKIIRRQARGASTSTASSSVVDSNGGLPRIDDPSVRVRVVTTASLPWMTGTAVNPLLRAAHLTMDRADGAVTLMVPWVDEADQRKLFPNNITFATQAEQRAYILQWVAEKASMPAAARKLRVEFYPGRYHPDYGSIFSMGPYVGAIEDGGICILEEPEHLCWYRCPDTGWMDKFEYVIGVMHTNYLMYAAQEKGFWALPPVWALNQLMCRAYCHKTVKLSDTLQNYAPRKECVCNVHGVRQAFLDAGRTADVVGFASPGDGSSPSASAAAAAVASSTTTTTTITTATTAEGGEAQVYFISKVLWAKGYRLLFDLLKHYQRRMGRGFAMDLYGSGPDAAAVGKKAASMSKGGGPGGARGRQFSGRLAMKGFADHAALGSYKVFVNPSITEVLCTTVAEALAMGKWVVCPKHPSNDFFEQFPNCLQYSTPDEFVDAVNWALVHDPPPLLPEVRGILSWESAMDRLRDASLLSPQELKGWKGRGPFDRLCCAFYRWLGRGPKGEFIRAVSGGGPVSMQNAYARKHKAQTEAGGAAAAVAAAPPAPKAPVKVTSKAKKTKPAAAAAKTPFTVKKKAVAPVLAAAAAATATAAAPPPAAPASEEIAAEEKEPELAAAPVETVPEEKEAEPAAAAEAIVPEEKAPEPTAAAEAIVPEEKAPEPAAAAEAIVPEEKAPEPAAAAAAPPPPEETVTEEKEPEPAAAPAAAEAEATTVEDNPPETAAEAATTEDATPAAPEE